MVAPLPAPDPETPLTTIHVRRAIEGRSESLDWVVQHFSPFLRVQARYRLGSFVADRTCIDDIVASAWLATLPRLRDLREREGRYTPVLLRFLSTTVRQIANDTIRDTLRRRPKHRGFLDDSESGDATPAKVQGALSQLESCETASLLGRSLRELEPELQEVLILRGIEGYSNVELAEQLGALPNTISHRYRRAVQALRASLPGSLFDELVDE